jgi:hypothetical protein
MTALSRLTGKCKLWTLPLVRELVPHQQTRKNLKKVKKKGKRKIDHGPQMGT